MKFKEPIVIIFEILMEIFQVFQPLLIALGQWLLIFIFVALLFIVSGAKSGESDHSRRD